MVAISSKFDNSTIPANSTSLVFATFSKLVTIMLSVVGVVVLFPVAVGPLVLVLLYRRLLQSVGPWVRPQLTKMVTARGAIFSGDAVYCRERPTINIVLESELDERMEIGRLRKIFEERIISVRKGDDDDAKEFKYPEFQQFIRPWGGYHWWEWDSSFDLSQHVKYHRIQVASESLRDEALSKFHEQLLQSGWPKNKPVWEMWLVDVDVEKGDNFTSRSTLFTKLHHSLADGFSLVSVFSNLSSKNYTSGNKPSQRKQRPLNRPLWKSILFLTTFPLRAVYEGSATLLQRVFQPPPFLAPLFPSTNRMHTACTKPIPLETIKDIKNHFGVTFTSTIHSVLAGALRDLMIFKGNPVIIPTNFPTLVPTPLAGHPEHVLRNYLGGALLNLQTGEADPIKRLGASAQEYEQMNRSTFPLLGMIGLKVAGCLPAWWVWLVGRNWLTSSYFTNFPSGKALDLDGVSVIGVKTGMGVFAGQTGLGVTAVSYLNDITISITGHGSVFSETDVKKLVTYLEQQITFLQAQISPV
ncbi:putative diacyglycerol O-acyltransferase Mb3154c [Folsomia candida]|uniref:putative diacyglycerol O-acyltransferase Mb3154c n=1 Tax=Folsomia candida TaxID=158441 RepID=UPI0016052A27|nr:putative diacyglycerol O-acyltransferase Mb3154c [Folsomia candida]